jgi:hypothetical protein
VIFFCFTSVAGYTFECLFLVALTHFLVPTFYECLLRLRADVHVAFEPMFARLHASSMQMYCEMC